MILRGIGVTIDVNPALQCCSYLIYLCLSLTGKGSSSCDVHVTVHIVSQQRLRMTHGVTHHRPRGIRTLDSTPSFVTALSL